MTLYEAFRSAWPGVTPMKQPFGLTLTRHRFSRGEYYKPTVAAHFVVLSGELEEVCQSSGSRTALLAIHRPREVIPNVVGRLRALRQVDLIELGPFWEPHLTGAAELVREAKAKQLAQTTQRLVDAMCDPVTERIHKFVATNSGVKSPTMVSKLLGCSREHASIVLRSMGTNGGRA